MFDLFVGFVCWLSQGSVNANKNFEIAQNSHSTCAIKTDYYSTLVTLHCIFIPAQISLLTAFLALKVSLGIFLAALIN